MFSVIELKSENGQHIGKDVIEVKILTGSKKPVLITPWGHYGQYPLIRCIYAQPKDIETDTVPLPGFRLVIHFENEIPKTAERILFNVYQEGATEYTVTWF